jgi:hypothetical protein
MRRLLILAVVVLPLSLFSCKKNKNNQDNPPVVTGVYLELTPVFGGSTITFRNDSTFTVQNLRLPGIVKHEYKYRIENGKMLVTPPSFDSYFPPNPLDFDTADGQLKITNFKPPLWTHDVVMLTFKKM